MATSFTFPSSKTSAFSTTFSSSSSSSPLSQLLWLQPRSVALKPDSGLNPTSFARFRVCASVNNFIVEKFLNGAPLVDTTKSDDLPQNEPADADADADAASFSAFVNQVADLVKLVDSRDIVELELKQLDCEVLIRKKEAMQAQSNAGAPIIMAQPQSQFQPQHSAPPPALPPPRVAVPEAEPPKPSISSHPPLKCPMAGTFYRAPAPGAAPFVKAGDKIQKGQVVCIIEAMKLMNEIEADQSGTVIDILVDDGKPVSLETPLFVIEP